MLEIAVCSQGENQPLLDVYWQGSIVMKHELGIAFANTTLGVQIEATATVKNAALDENFVLGFEGVPELAFERVSGRSRVQHEVDAWRSFPDAGVNIETAPAMTKVEAALGGVVDELAASLGGITKQHKFGVATVSDGVNSQA